MKNFVLFFILSFSIEGVFGETVSVIDGDSVTLHTGLTEIQEDDVLDWRFGAGRVHLARARKDSEHTYEDVLDGKYRGRLKLDGQTGDLTITNITTEHAGLYEISIDTIASRTFTVNVVPAGPVKSVSGDSVTLHTGVPEPQRYDVIEWRFGHLNSTIAEINRKTRNYFTSNTDERFRHRLQLDCWTGSLTIRNTETKHSGEYEVDLSTSNHIVHKSFTVTVSGEIKSALSVKKGESVTLHTDLTEIPTDGLMLWMFGDSQIAGISKAGDPFSTSDDVPDGRFRGRLKLDHQTGSLTITDTRYTDSGLYELKINSTRHKRFNVTVARLSQGEKAGIFVFGVLLAYAAVAAAAGVMFYQWRRIIELKEQKFRRLSVIVGESVTITPYRTEIHKDEDILWMFRGAVIAERKGVDQKFIYDDVLDKKFKGRLHLDKESGCLTITNIITTHSGRYELWSGRLGNKSLKTFRVSVFDKTDITEVSEKEGDSVKLETGVTGIQKDGQIVWKFGLDDSPIAQITDGTKKISRLGAGWRFRGRLELDHQTGSLTITKTKIKDAGFYVLYIFKSGNTSRKLIRVMLVDNPEDPTDNRNNSEEMPLRSVETFPDSRL